MPNDISFKCDCPNFVPSKETVSITVQTREKIVKAVLFVKDREGTLVHEENLNVSRGLRKLGWNGSTNKDDDREFANAQYSPYAMSVSVDYKKGKKTPECPPEFSKDAPISKVVESCEIRKEQAVEEEDQVEVVGEEEEVEEVQHNEEAFEHLVRILYHSIDIGCGRWNPTRANFDEGSDQWSALELSKNGYSAGPIHTVNGQQLTKAKQRYFSNSKEYYENNKQFDNGQFVTALKSGKAKEPLLTYYFPPSRNLFKKIYYGIKPVPRYRKMPPGASLSSYQTARPYRLYVGSIFHAADYATHMDQLRDQYTNNNYTKMYQEQQKLNRPLIPLEARIWLKGKDGRKLWFPKSVGNVRVDWSALEPPEDTDLLFADQGNQHSYSKSYVKKVKTNLNLNTEDKLANNCPNTLGGLNGVANGWRALFWNESNGAYPPYLVEQDDEASIVFSCAYTLAQYPHCQGHAGILFNPSIIGGDRYQVKARLNFGDVQSLGTDNGTVECTTNTIEIWRYLKVASLVKWPGRNIVNKQFWRSVRTEFEKAYVDMDTSSISSAKVSKYLQSKDYKDWFTTSVGPYITNFGVEEYNALIKQDVDSKGVISLIRNPTKDDFDLLFWTSYALFSTEPTNLLYGSYQFNHIILNAIRPHCPHGLVIVDFSLFSRDISDVPDPNKYLVGKSLGAEDGLVVISNATLGELYYIFSHEIGHCLWLRHWEMEGGGQEQDTGPDHDNRDHNCMMSYCDDNSQYAHRYVNNYRPHFCGKCNLKLRGWDVRDQNMPTDSANG